MFQNSKYSHSKRQEKATQKFSVICKVFMIKIWSKQWTTTEIKKLANAAS